MNNLKKIRLEKGYTQDYLAKILGVSESTYSRYESEKRKLDSEVLKKLSEFYNLSIDYLVGNTEVPMTLTEVRFNKEVDHLSDKELISKYDLVIDDEPISEEEAKKILKIIRALGK